jgi:hypothetical protein
MGYGHYPPIEYPSRIPVTIKTVIYSPILTGNFLNPWHSAFVALAAECDMQRPHFCVGTKIINLNSTSSIARVNTTANLVAD